MPKIEQPNDLAACIAQNDALTAKVAEFEAKVKEFEDTAKKFEATEKAFGELTTEVEALRMENTELKEAVAASEEVGDQIKAEVAKNVELTDTKNSLVETLIAKDNQIKELEEKAQAFEDLASEYAEEVESVQDQFALLKKNLATRGLVPDVETVPNSASSEIPASYKTWLELSNSPDSADRITARRMKRENPEIEAQIQKNANAQSAKPVTAPSTSKLTPEQLSVFGQWAGMRSKAKEYSDTKQYKLHAEATTEARRFYNKDTNKATIDACLAAGMTA